MFEWLDSVTFTSAQRNLISTAVVALLVLVIRWLVLRVVHRRIEDAQVWFRTRKYTTYAAFVVVVLALVNIWLGGVGGALTYVGIVSAGIAIALTDVLKNLVGWAYILVRRPFRVGDRVEIAGHAGDVVDIRVFRFTLIEIGNWVAADQSTGRLVHVPNGILFTESVANYTESFPFIWDEIPVMVTFESDWELAERLVLEAVQAHAPDRSEQRFAQQIRTAAHGYFIRFTHLDPIVYVSVDDSGVVLTGRYLVGVRERRGIKDKMWRAVLHSFAEHPTVDLAYPTVRTYLPDSLRIHRDPEGPQRSR